MKRTVAHLVPDHNPFPPTYAAGTELRVEQVARRQSRYRPVVICGCSVRCTATSMRPEDGS